jgi:site-specific DNA-methyltransferase (adenine-specific)
MAERNGSTGNDSSISEDLRGEGMIGKIYNECNLVTMARMPDGFIDLTVTSPPYDNLRTYNGYSWDCNALSDSLFRATKQGGIVVWVVGDATIDGDETGTSFKQALTFKSNGWKLWDTMIWRKPNPIPMDSRIPRYLNAFEYMFVFSKGKPATCNHLRETCLTPGLKAHNNYPARRENGAKSFDRVVSKTSAVADTRVRHNVWDIPVNNGAAEGIAIEHPAIFPVQLVKDHVATWTDEGDLVYDCFMGSGTTAKAAHQLGRRWIGSEISSEYCEIANKRLEPLLMQSDLFT